jgi:hypothetical protein
MFVNNIFKGIRRIGSKQLVAGSAFAVALACSIGLGLATRQQINAAVIRDNDPVNSIDGCSRNGGIGAADANELIKDIKDAGTGNCKTDADLAGFYGHFGLTADKYNTFINEHKNGTLFRDGHVEVDGVTVMTGASTYGRTSMGKPASERKPVNVNGKTYYTSTPNVSFASGRQSLPVMVMFENGAPKTVIMNACGNPVTGNPVNPKAVCNALNQTQPDKTKKPNTYNYTTNASFSGNASLSRVVYHFSDDNTTVTKTKLTDVVEHTFKKDGKVTVTVYAKVPGGKEIKATGDCEKQVKYVPPFYMCTALVASALDSQKRKFRFTVKVSMDATTTLKGVDFSLDGAAKTAGSDKDAQGNYYKDYEFTDEKTHKVVATVNFNTAQGVQSKTCEASATATKIPVCEVPGKSHLPPNHPDCGYCKPGIPFGSEACKDIPQVKGETTMPETGAGSVAGLFVGTTAIGAIGHRLVTKFRSRRS